MKSRQGSIYLVKAHQLSFLKGYAELDFLTKAESAFLIALLELTQRLVFESNGSGNGLVEISRSELGEWLKLKGVGSSATLIKKRSQQFLELKIFSKETRTQKGTPPVDIFMLMDYAAVVANSKSRHIFQDHRKTKNQLRDLRHELIESDAQILDRTLPVQYARSERLWCYVLGSCMRTGFSAADKIGPYSTHYQFCDDVVEIITSAQSDSEIAHINDLRTIRAIMTMVCLSVMERETRHSTPSNEFFVDIVDLCSLMGLDGSGANRDTVRRSMERLYSTNFHIALDHQSSGGKEFAEFFDLRAGADDVNFRFLTEMDSSLDREHGGASVRRPRWYRIVLHSKTFQDLLNKDTYSVFIDNLDLLTLGPGILHLFYSWCSRRCKRSGNIKATISSRELNKQLLPRVRSDNFTHRLIEQLREHSISNGGTWVDGEANITNLFGYKVKSQPDNVHGYLFTCWRDKKDPIVGDGSLHNVLRSQVRTQGSLLLED